MAVQVSKFCKLCNWNISDLCDDGYDYFGNSCYKIKNSATLKTAYCDNAELVSNFNDIDVYYVRFYDMLPSNTYEKDFLLNPMPGNTGNTFICFK